MSTEADKTNAPAGANGNRPPNGAQNAATNTPRNVMARLGRLGRAPSGHAGLEPLYQAVHATHPRMDLTTVDRAYVVARDAHEGQMHRSGDPYITHPVSVATILAELGMQPAVLVARSEEHTSELQSRGHLVCRLLLEKKKHEEDIRPL